MNFVSLIMILASNKCLKLSHRGFSDTTIYVEFYLLFRQYFQMLFFNTGEERSNSIDKETSREKRSQRSNRGNKNQFNCCRRKYNLFQLIFARKLFTVIFCFLT